MHNCVTTFVELNWIKTNQPLKVAVSSQFVSVVGNKLQPILACPREVKVSADIFQLFETDQANVI